MFAAKEISQESRILSNFFSTPGVWTMSDLI